MTADRLIVCAVLLVLPVVRYGARPLLMTLAVMLTAALTEMLMCLFLRRDVRVADLDSLAIGAMVAMQEAAALGLMIVVHAGMDPSFPQVHHSTPERIARAARQLPGAVLIAAHCGGFGYLDDAEKYLVGTGVYLDTSQLGHYPREQVLRILHAHDPKRLLFASDTPWDDQKAALERFCALPLDESLKNRILGENAVRLLGSDI